MTSSVKGILLPTSNGLAEVYQVGYRALPAIGPGKLNAPVLLA